MEKKKLLASQIEVIKMKLKKAKEEKKRIKDLEDLLKNVEVVLSYDENKIDIGTHFVATLDFDGEMETDEYVLVDNRDGVEKGINAISKDSLFGSSIIGKELGEPFNYQIGNMTVVGFVEDIVPEKEVSVQMVKKSK